MSLPDFIQKLTQNEKFSKKSYFDYSAAVPQQADMPLTLNDQKTVATGPSGEKYKAVISGSPNRVTSGVRLSADSVYIMDDKEFTIFNNSSGGGFVVVGGWPTPVAPNTFGWQVASSFPQFGIIDLESPDTLYVLPVDTSKLVYSPVINPDILTSLGYDGSWCVQLNSDATEMAIIRLIYSIQGYVGIGGVGPLSQVEVRWLLLKGIARDSSTNEITYSSFEEGTQSHLYAGNTYGAGIVRLPLGAVIVGSYNTLNMMEMFPVMRWDSITGFDFDLIGDWRFIVRVNWFVPPGPFGGPLSGLNFTDKWGTVYGTSMKSGGALSIGPVDKTTGIFEFGQLYNALVRPVTATLNFRYDQGVRAWKGDGTSNSNLSTTTLAGQDRIFGAPISWDYCKPYTVLSQVIGTGNIGFGIPGQLAAAFDSSRYYPADPLWLRYSNDTGDSSSLKVTDEAAFTGMQVTSNPGIKTLDLTNFGWDTVHDVATSGSTGSGDVPYPYGGHPWLITIMDWILQG